MRIRIDGREFEAPEQCSVAAAILNTGAAGFAPLCGMGICMQCRATVDGAPLMQACQLPCREGMTVETR